MIDVACRVAAFLDRWQWLFLALAAPFLLFSSPTRSVALLVVPGLWILAWIATGQPLPKTPLNGALLLLGLMVLVSLYATYDMMLSLPRIAGMVLGLGVFYAFARYGRRAGGWWLCLGVFVATGMGWAVLGLLSMRWIDKFGPLAAATALLPSGIITVSGSGGGLHPNGLAGALTWVMPVLIALSGLLIARYGQIQSVYGRSWMRLAAAGVGMVTVFGIGMFLLTQSRGGYLAFGLTGLTLVAGWLGLRRRWLLLTGLSLALIIGGWLLISLGPDTVLETVAGGNPEYARATSLDTFQGRLEMWSRAVYGIHDFPFTGMGLNTFRRLVHVLYPMLLVGPGVDITHAHNEFLQVALDVGLPGLVAFVALYLGAFWMLREIWLATDGATQPDLTERTLPPLAFSPLTRALVLGLGAGLWMHLVWGLTDAITLGMKTGILFWMLLGLIAGLFEQACGGTME